MYSFTQKMIMYYDIQKLRGDKLSVSQICQQLDLNWRTVNKYLQMSEQEYLQFIEKKQNNRTRDLVKYTDFVHQRLGKYPLTSAAQMHDLLKENFADFPAVNPKTIYNFTIHVRQVFQLSKEGIFREFMAVEELPYGQQAQVDFGVYNMQNTAGQRQKVWFFMMCLSRSRYRFVFFSQIHFTSQTTVVAHEKAFEFFEGITQTVVYDQDRLLICDENMGEYMLTEIFKKYTDLRKFQLHFCRKADPQSKGKVENNVKYVKQNFLYGRIFSDIETLNNQALDWLKRTANAMPHSTTKKSPALEWIIEKEVLKPFTGIMLPVTELPLYCVRKSNTITYKGNSYSLPIGTYKGRTTQVKLQEKDGHIFLFSLQNILITKHQIPVNKGNTIVNTNHKRNKSIGIDELISQVSELFEQPVFANNWFEQIRLIYPRHIRDHVVSVKEQITNCEADIVNKTIEFCVNNKLFSANDFKGALADRLAKSKTRQVPQQTITPLAASGIEPNDLTPQTSDINVYEQLMK